LPLAGLFAAGRLAAGREVRVEREADRAAGRAAALDFRGATVPPISLAQ
jgi:hypothetical protein